MTESNRIEYKRELSDGLERRGRSKIRPLPSPRTRNTLSQIPSPRTDLRFRQLAIYYEARGIKLDDGFMNKLELLTPEGNPNFAAYLLADENAVSFQLARYASTDRTNLVDKRDYGRCSLVKAAKFMLDRIDVENITFTRIGLPLRQEREMIDTQAITEAVINAVLHNDYSNGGAPKVELFSNRVEITSIGGLSIGMEEEDFFNGYLLPRNRELMRVFRDLHIANRLGTGIPRILAVYGRDAFELRESHVRVTLPYAEPLHNPFPRNIS